MFFFFFKQKTAYDVRISDWSSDVCSSDLFIAGPEQRTLPIQMFEGVREQISPAIAAAATLLVLASTLLLGAAELLRRRGDRISRDSAAPDVGASSRKIANPQLFDPAPGQAPSAKVVGNRPKASPFGILGDQGKK